jgi:hypothetical protein
MKVQKQSIVKLPSGINTSAMEYWPVVSADDSTLYFTRQLRNPLGYSHMNVFSKHFEGWRCNWEMPLK